MTLGKIIGFASRPPQKFSTKNFAANLPLGSFGDFSLIGINR